VPEYQEIEDKVKEIICDQMSVSRDKLASDTHFINDLGADSLDTVELVMELEEVFDLNIPDEDAEQIQTVGQAIDYIAKHS
jgi:acyl carrier protein